MEFRVRSRKKKRKAEKNLKSIHRKTRDRKGPILTNGLKKKPENPKSKRSGDSRLRQFVHKFVKAPDDVEDSDETGKESEARSFYKVIPKVTAESRPKPNTQPKSGTPEVLQENQHPLAIPNMAYLLLENWAGYPSTPKNRSRTNSSQCFMNCISNMLYVCKDIRSQFLCYGSQKPNQNLVTSIFRGDTDSAREWRKTLPQAYRTGHQDIAEVFEYLVKALLQEIPTLPIQLDRKTQSKCQGCQRQENNTETLAVSNLVIGASETFAGVLHDQYGDTFSHFPCDCGGQKIKKQTYSSRSMYHFMLIDSHSPKSINLEPNHPVPMFGSVWKVIAFAHYLPITKNGKTGHYVSWIREGEDEWTCVDDEKDDGFREAFIDMITE